MGNLTRLSLCLASIALVLAGVSVAQRGPGDGRRGRGNFPVLNIKDVKPAGTYEVVNLLPGANEQSRIGISKETAYRLISYDEGARALKFAALDLKSGAPGSKLVRLPSDAPNLGKTPRMSCDGGEWAVVSRQAATVFVNVDEGKAEVASDVDKKASIDPIVARQKSRRHSARAGQEYRVHGGAGGRWALSALVETNADATEYTGHGGVVHFPGEKSVRLEWNHAKYGVPPKGRDAVCAVTDDEIIVLTTHPKTRGDFKGLCELHCLVFDKKGQFKEAQTSPESWASNNASRFALSPDGAFIVAHPEDSLHRFVVNRGTWKRGYQTDYHDALVGFSHDGALGVFIENHATDLAAIKAVKLPGGEEVWKTYLSHESVQGEGEDEPFTGVSADASVVAMKTGVLEGKSGNEPVWIYKTAPVEFDPLCISYDADGKLVGVLSRDRVFVIDARTREELHSISFEKPLPKGALGEFVTFNEDSERILACVRNEGVWLIDLEEDVIEKTLPPVKGTWARAMPDFSGVVYSQSKQDGGNVMLQKLKGGEPERIYRCAYKDSLAVCFHINDKCDEFLVTEREVGTGRLFLIDDEGEKIVTYDVENKDTNLVGDETVTGFVTKRHDVVLINEVSRWRYTGINCTVVSPKEGVAIQGSFSAVFESADLPGRSTYGDTAASPFFGGVFAGDDRECFFACPAGVLEIDIKGGSILLHAWSRKPLGLAAVSPKGKEFFVAGAGGLTTYEID